MRLYQRGWAQRERERERAGVDEIINSGQWENSDLRGGQNRKTRFEMLTDKDKVIDDGDGRTDGRRERRSSHDMNEAMGVAIFNRRCDSATTSPHARMLCHSATCLRGFSIAVLQCCLACSLPQHPRITWPITLLGESLSQFTIRKSSLISSSLVFGGISKANASLNTGFEVRFFTCVFFLASLRPFSMK